MKKTCTILTFIICGSMGLNAQINLEHTFGANESILYFNTSSNTLFYSRQGNVVKFYNENYSLYKSLTIVPPSGYDSYSLAYASDKLFNNDNNIEFLLNFKKQDNTDFMCRLLNENGNVLVTFNNSTYYYVLATKNNGYKLLMNKYSNGLTTFNIEVYSLPGILTSEENNEVIYNGNYPFPNPSEGIISLPYSISENETNEMYILNINGQLIESMKIDGYNKQILLNTSYYSPGIYLYQYKDIRNTFIVK